ncbi:Uncharacterised protein [Streptococcus pneumoniae]|nr:Uncharacterised protein [Streptococcus pneumoniae]
MFILNADMSRVFKDHGLRLPSSPFKFLQSLDLFSPQEQEAKQIDFNIQTVKKVFLVQNHSRQAQHFCRFCRIAITKSQSSSI